LSQNINISLVNFNKEKLEIGVWKLEIRIWNLGLSLRKQQSCWRMSASL